MTSYTVSAFTLDDLTKKKRMGLPVIEHGGGECLISFGPGPADPQDGGAKSEQDVRGVVYCLGSAVSI